MKVINRTLVLLSALCLNFIGLEGKKIEIRMDHTTCEQLDLKQNIPKLRHEQPFFSGPPKHYTQKLIIENLGNEPILQCFPYINEPPCFNIKALAMRLKNETYPLLCLYHLWNRSVIATDQTSENNDSEPLDVMNFKGSCSRKNYQQQFLKLCNALGLGIRLANVVGKKAHDFGIDDEWSFLDFENHQFYLGLNNETLASSEEIMDDPFLVLRTQHARRTEEMSYAKSWKNLASFDILQPASAVEVNYSLSDVTKRKNGFDLFPGETFTFESASDQEENIPYKCATEHVIDLEARAITRSLNIHSPTPVLSFTNNSTSNVYLTDHNIELKPGQVHDFEQAVLKVNISFSAIPKGKVILSGSCSWILLPNLVKGTNQICLGTKKNNSNVRFTFEVNENLEKKSLPEICVVKPPKSFNYAAPFFQLERSNENVEKIWWQVALDKNFQLVTATLDRVEPFNSKTLLSVISETFLSPETKYYFRVKGYQNGEWGDWSKTVTFTVKKPAQVESISFDQIDDNEYEINWERYADKPNKELEYLIFGSNAIDFIPSIYCNRQVNAIIDNEATEEEENDNLIAITTIPKIKVSGDLAYYRIIARKRDQLSVPSKLIRVYDRELIQPRNVLQVDKDESTFIAKRMLFPLNFSCSKRALPCLTINAFPEPHVIKLQTLMRSMTNHENGNSLYQYPDVEDKVWEQVDPYLLPENHPAWAKLNRVFCKTRATQTPEHFKRAGFRRWRPGRWSRVAASANPEFPEYFIKAYCDSERGILYDWKKWIHRIHGAETIRKCIKKNALRSNFKVPRKWIYPLPKHPSPPDTHYYVRKNFILICENMNIMDHDSNERMYKKEMTRELMNGLYIILQVCGLYDSVYVFNMPFCRDGKIAIIDTEYHHKWPVPFQKLEGKFSKTLRSYWKRLTYKGGKIPDGVPQHNPPRMDRRDVKIQL